MSAIKTVVATVNGQQYTLTYNAQTGAYEASITAPTNTSYHVNDGHYYPVSVVATDIAGNTTTINDTDAKFGNSLKLRVKETVKPEIKFITPTSGAGLTNNKPTFKLQVTDAGSGIDLSTFKLVIDGSETWIGDCTYTEIANGYEITHTMTTALADGSHTIVGKVSDNDGNAATDVSITIKVDTVPPTLTITAPADQIYVNKEGCTVNGTTNDATSSPVSVEITLNGNSVGSATVQSDGSFSKAITLVAGENIIEVTATDALGKFTKVTRTVFYDSSAPEFVSVSIAPNPVNTGATYKITVKLSS